jgi:hypothetical protein
MFMKINSQTQRGSPQELLLQDPSEPDLRVKTRKNKHRLKPVQTSAG